MNSTEVPNRRIKIACPSCSQKIDVTECEAFSHVSCPSCGQDLIVPKWFHSFLLEQPEGEGGMATVYRALDIQLDREVAIKVLNREQIGTRISSELFLHEARTAAAINHNAVVPIYSCGENEGAPFIVMQYMNGGNLETRLERLGGRLPVPQVTRWLHDISDGLRYASERGVIHHDIKPANILLDIDNNAKIGDFGLAQVMMKGTNAADYIAPGKMWLSPHYVSPEKVLNGTEGPEGDIYSLGATFYHLLTGKTPFHNHDTEELVRMRLLSDPVPPVLIRPEIGDSLSKLILDMMDRNPAKRPDYPTILRTLDACQQEQQHGGVPAADAGQPQAQQRPKRILHVEESRLHGKRRRVSHVGSLLFLFAVVCFSSAALLLPKYGDLRKAYNMLPFLDAVYGPLSLEKVSFVQTDRDDEYPSFERSVRAAEDVFSDDPNYTSLSERINAAWLLSVNALLNDSSEAVSLARTLHEQLENAAKKTPLDVRADLYCLEVIAKKANTPPEKCYFSEEQQARCAIGKFLRGIYDTDPESFSKRTIQAYFNEVEETLLYLKPESSDESASWVFKLFYPELGSWNSVIEGKPSADAEPIFTHISTNKQSSDY